MTLNIKPTNINIWFTPSHNGHFYGEIWWAGKTCSSEISLVALGNLDPHQWTKSKCFSHVMSLLELCLLTEIAVRHNQTLKSGNVKQAFVQVLPPTTTRMSPHTETNILETSKNTIWIKTVSSSLVWQSCFTITTTRPQALSKWSKHI